MPADNQPHHDNISERLSLHPSLFIEKEVKFSFKKQTVKDELGAAVKRPPVTVTIPVPTFAGLVKSFEDAKVQQFVIDLVEEAIRNQAKEQVSDDEKPVNRQDELDLSKLTLEYIANIPKSERTGGGISKETWEEFERDYVSVMLQHTDKGKERIERAAKLLLAKFNPVRTEKTIIKFLRDQLNLWAGHSENMDELGEVYTYLDNKATDLLKRDNTELLASL